MFAHNPLHGSGQAGFPHPALALGEDAHAAQGIGMTDESVNASTPPLRAAPHDSGPMWVVDPLSYDSCIHYTSPV
jgi:hypothetical protein